MDSAKSVFDCPKDRIVYLALRFRADFDKQAVVGQGADVELFCSDFIHNSKKRRSAANIAENARELPFLRQIPSVPYASRGR